MYGKISSIANINSCRNADNFSSEIDVRPQPSMREKILIDKINNPHKGHFLRQDMFYSAAFQSLSRSAMKLYVAIALENKWSRAKRKNKKDNWVSINNSELIFTYKDGKDLLKLNDKQFRDGLKELVEKGLIDITHRGGSSKKDPSTYALSMRWKDYGKESFNTVKWQPDNRLGVGWNKYHSDKSKVHYPIRIACT